MSISAILFSAALLFVRQGCRDKPIICVSYTIEGHFLDMQNIQLQMICLSYSTHTLRDSRILLSVVGSLWLENVEN